MSKKDRKKIDEREQADSATVADVDGTVSADSREESTEILKILPTLDSVDDETEDDLLLGEEGITADTDEHETAEGVAEPKASGPDAEDLVVKKTKKKSKKRKASADDRVGPVRRL